MNKVLANLDKSLVISDFLGDAQVTFITQGLVVPTPS
jgi:hypothetical protein